MRSIYNKYAEGSGAYARVYPDNSTQYAKRDITALFKNILPDGLDSGDLMLLIILLLLYIESDDSDFLIVLAVIAFSIFKNRS